MVDVVGERIQRTNDDALAALRGLYGDRANEVWARLTQIARTGNDRRSDALRELDLRREIDRGWYLANRHVGYKAYAKKFGGTLTGISERIPHLRHLGVTFLHLMSVLQPRAGDSDGGYAIDDYTRPDPQLGTTADLEALARELAASDINLILDLVLNHTSDQHEWARSARAGSAYHQNLYLAFEDRTEPDRYEATLPEVFPTMAPGNFTHVAPWGDDEQGRWVWTTFREFQWDLNWANPDVMYEMAAIAVTLANMGVSVLRLDAIAFTWKRLGTTCQNEPEAHLVAQALRAVLEVAAPATLLLAEAIVGPADLVGYLGGHEFERSECHLAYHNQLMVQGWSMLASRDVGLARVALNGLPTPPPSTTWFTYVRNHDDIGWAIDDGDAAAVGISGRGHRDFLAAYYRGDFDGSHARGTPFSSNPTAGDERTAGMTATLVGLAAASEAAIGESAEVGPEAEAALARHRFVYALAYGWGGIPLLYMGDEFAQLDAPADDASEVDSRWLNRPDWDPVLARVAYDQPNSIPGRAMATIVELGRARQACKPLHGGARSIVLDDAQGVFVWQRRHPRYGLLLGLANPHDHTIDASEWAASVGPAAVDVLGAADRWILEPRAVRWITDSVHSG